MWGFFAMSTATALLMYTVIGSDTFGKEISFGHVLFIAAFIANICFAAYTLVKVLFIGKKS
jgi:hypothetical protein